MNTTNAAVGAGALVVVGRWSEPHGPGVLDTRLVVGVVLLAVFLAVLPDKVAQPMSWLILLTLTFRYAPSILAHTGVAQTSANTKRPPTGGVV